MARIRCAAFLALGILAEVSGTMFAQSATPPSCLSVSPAAVTLPAGHAQQFKAALTGSDGSTVKWMVSGVIGGNASVGRISSSGLYTAPAVFSSASVTVTAAGVADNHLTASVTVILVEDPAVREAHEQWLAGVSKAATGFGCGPDLIQQLPTESVTEVLHLFALTARNGSCLVLLPVSTDPNAMRYSFASGGKIDGVEIRYLSDVGQMRVWNGAEATGN